MVDKYAHRHEDIREIIVARAINRCLFAKAHPVGHLPLVFAVIPLGRCTFGLDKPVVFEIKPTIAMGVSKVIHYISRYKMPTKNPCINVALEKPLYLLIEKLARQRGLSLSMVTRDLIREALEIHEDAVLSTVAEEREATLTDRDTLTHDEVWG